MQTFRNFIGSEKSKTCELIGFSAAFLADLMSFILGTTSIKKTSLKIAELTLSSIPSATFITTSLVTICYPGNNQREESIGAAALSYFQSSFYLLVRTALDLALILAVEDYLHHENPSEKIINGFELAAESFYMYSFFLSKPLENLLERCFNRAQNDEPVDINERSSLLKDRV